MRWAVSKLPSDEAANISRMQPDHIDDTTSELLLQQLPDDAAMVATGTCRQAADISQVVVVPA
jgi:hypothetical protein